MTSGIPTLHQLPLDEEMYKALQSRCPGGVEQGEHMYAIKRYKEFLIKKTGFSTAKINRICYAAESIINDISKLMLLLIIGFVTGKIELFVSVLLTYTVLRPLLGGMHKESYWGCFFSTGSLILLAMAIILFTPFGGWYTVIYTGFICSIGISLGPVGSSKKKKITQESRNRKRAIVIHIVIVILYILSGEEEIRNGLLAGLWLEHGQIIILSIKNKKEKNPCCFIRKDGENEILDFSKNTFVLSKCIDDLLFWL